MKNKSIINLIIWFCILTVLTLGLDFLLHKIGLKSSELNGNLSALVNKQSSLKNLRTDFLYIEPYEKQIDALLPNQNNVVDLAEYIEEKAKSYSSEYTLHFDEGKNNKMEKKEAKDKINLILDGKININNFTKLVNDFEMGPYFIQISTFEIDSSENINQESNYKLNLIIDAEKIF